MIATSHIENQAAQIALFGFLLLIATQLFVAWFMKDLLTPF
jgi:hypothetical protein